VGGFSAVAPERSFVVVVCNNRGELNLFEGYQGPRMGRRGWWFNSMAA
jgi:hypothetical protein